MNWTCFFIGHKFIVKAMTGETFDTKDPLTGLPCKGQYFRWEAQDHCIRCCKKNPNIEKE